MKRYNFFSFYGNIRAGFIELERIRSTYFKASKLGTLAYSALFSNSRAIESNGSLITFILTFLFLSIMSPNGFSQPDTPCGCTDPFEIGEDIESETDVSTIDFVDGYCYLIHGTLIIDEPTWFYNLRFLMAEGSQILVEDGFSMDQCYLSACENMWQGIKDFDNQNIFVYNSIIESAEFGIQLGSVPGFVCLYNKFINNYIGVAVGSPFDQNQRGIEIYRGQLWGNEFYTDSALPPPYPGQFYYPSWSSTVGEVAIDQGYAAIYLSGLTGLNIGYVGAKEAERNYIHDMRNGVILRHTIGDIYGTDFSSFEGGAPDHLNTDQLDFNQLAVHAYSSTTTIEDNTVDEVIRGFWGHESYMHIFNNELSISTGSGSPLFRSRGIYLHRPEKTIIDSNIINNGNVAISVIEAQSPYSIIENELNRTYPGFRPGNIGILVRGTTEFDSEGGLIKDNEITIVDGNGSFGIYLINDHNIRVTRNEIDYEVDEGHDTQNRGIAIVGGNDHFILGNEVLAHHDYIDLYNWGIVAQNSSANSIECNTIDGFDQNIRIDGPNTHTQLIRNLIYEAKYGLELNSPSDMWTQFFTVEIGTQEHNRNQWLGTYNGMAEFGAHISGYDPIETALQSRFIVDTGEDDDFMPDPIGPSSVSSGIWFLDLPSVDDPELACIANPIKGVFSPDTIAKVLQNGYDFTDFNDQMVWSMKANIIDMILSDNSLLSNTVIDSFYTVEDASAMGILVAAQRNMASVYGGDRTDRYLELDTIYSLAQDLRYIDSILFLKPIDSATWISLRALKVDSLTLNTDVWLDLLEDQNIATQDEYESISIDVAAVTPTNDLEEYLQEALSFKLKYLLGGSFGSGDSTDIYDLAELCLWEGGRAVNIGIELATVLDSFMSVTEVNCPSPSPYNERPSSNPTNEGLDLTFSPNPATEHINVTSSNIISQVSISDISGKVLFQSRPGESIFTISPLLSPGMYLIVARDIQGNINNEFIFIQ